MSDLNDRIANLSADKRALLDRILEQKKLSVKTSSAPQDRIVPVSRDTAPPLSFAQERMWFLSQLGAAYAPYNNLLPLRFKGALSSELLVRAIREIVNRHELLRTRFMVIGGEPVQVVHGEEPVEIPIVDLRGKAPAEREAAVRELAYQEIRIPINLSTDQLLRCRLLVLGPMEHVLLLTMHHIVIDEWSADVFFRELSVLYKAFSLGKPPPLPALPVQYADYAIWQRGSMQNGVIKEQLHYWRKQLKGMQSLQLPIKGARPQVQTFTGASCTRAVSDELRKRTKKLIREERVTPFMMFLTIFVILLHRYTEQDDIVVGSPAANRNRPEIENLIGFFVNSLILRTDVSGNPSFHTLLGRVREMALGAYANQDVPFEKLVDELEQERDLTRNPLFQASFNMLNVPLSDMEPEGLSVSVVPLEVQSSRIDLEFNAMDTEQGTAFQVLYNPDLFEESMVRHMLGHYERILHAAVSDPEARIGDIELLSDADRHRLLVDWNAPRDHRNDEQTLVDRFRDWAVRQPDLIAADFGQASLSYAQLDAATNRFACSLREEGVKRGDRVGLCVERGPGLVIGILSIWKAGAAYLPLDPKYPESRLQFMLEDAEVKCVLTDAVTRPQIERVCGTVRLVDIALHKSAEYAQSELPELPGSTDLAYMIYTSGSTGQPKAALLEHRGLVNVSEEQVRLFGAGPGHRVLQFSSPSFDAATFDLVMALGSGATLVLAEAESIRPGPPLAETLREKAISILTIPPSALGALSHTDLPSLKVINVAGEACPPQLVSRWCGDGRRFFNLYGPTECTIWSTYAECQADDQAPPIGRPIANVPCYVLDQRGRLAAAGIPGELYIGGVGVARGYWRREELNRERFVADPFSEEQDALMYRTGDLVRWSGDGLLHFIGRIDEQVKLRGFRVELGEIEAVLGNHPDVGEAVVVSLEDESGDQRLVAYLVHAGEDPPSVTQVREHARAHLPVYMVPASWVTLEALPLTPNGKVDRGALPSPEGERQTEQAYVAPRNELEQRIAGIWCELLGIDQVGIDDNFFDLGGHSLLLIRLRARLESELGVEVPMVKLFQHPTVDAVTRFLDGDKAAISLHETARKRAASLVGQDRRSAAIAVVGMAGRFPQAGSVPAYWEALRNGEELIRFFNDEELAAAGVPEALRSADNYVPARAVLDDVELFDAGFFGYTPREAELMDPQQRLFLESAYQALEDAGIDPSRYAGLIGVYAGCSTSSYMQQVISNPELAAVVGGMQLLIGNDKDFLPTRVSYKLNLRGPSVNVQTACSTSLVAVHMACRSLLEHECDVALAGGVSVSVPRVSGYRYTEQGIMSPDGHCRAFDAESAGTVGGEGVGVVVLKRLDEALRDGDPIRAVIRGTAINNDGSAKVGYTAPSVERQAEAIALAQSVAGIEPSSIGYIEAHGTATSLGDPIEVEALNLVFAEGDYQQGRCALGSVKSNMGHLDAAAGVASLIKTVLMLEHGEIPPSLHYEAANPEIDFAAGPFYVNTALKPWERLEGQRRRAGVSSFGIGGTNAHAVLEEAPEIAASDPSRRCQVLPVSAKSEAALGEACENLAAHLEQHPELALADVSHTLRVGREQHAWRRAVVSEDVAGGIDALRSRGRAKQAPTASPEVVFLYPGQGTQYPNMGRELYEDEPVYRDTVDQCCAVLAEPLGLDLRTLLYPQAGDEDSAAESLKRTSLTQPALFVTEYALTQLLAEWGIRPVAMLGHSIGELVAACVSGVLDRDAALRLVAQRGRLMESAPAGVMISVLASAQQARGYEGDDVWLSVVNGPQASVLSCTPQAADALESRLQADDVAYQRLQTSHAFHCGLMDGVLEPLDAVSGDLKMSAPQLPYVSNVTGGWVDAELMADATYWSRQVREPVRFAEGVETMLGRYPDAVLLEVGPGITLTQLTQSQVERRIPVLNTLPKAGQPGADEQCLAECLGELWRHGLTANWLTYDLQQACRRVTLPGYPFQRKRYWVERRAPGALVSRPARRPDIDDWFYLRNWQSTPVLSAALQDTSIDRPKTWLLFADGAGLAEALAKRLLTAGHSVIVAGIGKRFVRIGDDRFTLRANEISDYGSMLDTLLEQGQLPQEVVHLWGVEQPKEGEVSSIIDNCFYSPMLFAQALAQQNVTSPMRMVLITTDMHCVAGSETIIAEKATCIGPLRVIPAEFPNISCRNIDLPLSPATAVNSEVLDWLQTELEASRSEPIVAYRQGCRWTPGQISVRLDTHADTGYSLSERGVYLITGGLGGIGIALARYLADTVSARLVLVTRRAFPRKSQWDVWITAHPDCDRVSQAIAAVRDIESRGAEVMLVSADVTDAGRMREVIRDTRKRFGDINGVIHAAGVAGGGVIQLKTRDVAAGVLAPKVQGIRVLVEALKHNPPEFMVLCSSMASLTGLPGQVDYTAANAFLDAFALEQRGNPSTRILSINWGTWREAGMAAETEVPENMERLRSESLALGISTNEGQQAFARVLTSPWPQVVVSPQPIRTGAQGPAAAEVTPELEVSDDNGGSEVTAYQRPDLDQEFVEPGTPIERQLADIWGELLGVEQVGVNDSFLDLGGHSLLATQVTSRIRGEFGIAIGLEELLASPTIAELAVRIENLRWVGMRPDGVVEYDGNDRESDEI